MKDLISTSGLMSMLQSDSAPNILHKGKAFSAPSFSEHLRQKMALYSMSVTQLITAASVSKTYMYQILRDERHAGRDVVLRIALAMHLTVDETQRLLTLSSNGILYPRIRRDAALIFALTRRMTLPVTEELLLALPERSVYGLGD